MREMLPWGMSDRYGRTRGFETRSGGVRRRPCHHDDAFVAEPVAAAIVAAAARK